MYWINKTLSVPFYVMNMFADDIESNNCDLRNVNTQQNSVANKTPMKTLSIKHPHLFSGDAATMIADALQYRVTHNLFNDNLICEDLYFISCSSIASNVFYCYQWLPNQVLKPLKWALLHIIQFRDRCPFTYVQPTYNIRSWYFCITCNSRESTQSFSKNIHHSLVI